MKILSTNKKHVVAYRNVLSADTNNNTAAHCLIASTCSTQWTQCDMLTPAVCLTLISVQASPTPRVLLNAKEAAPNGVIS